METEKLLILEKINTRVKEIINNENLTWKERYDLIFNKDIAFKVLFPYTVNPNVDCSDDIIVWYTAFKEYHTNAIVNAKNYPVSDSPLFYSELNKNTELWQIKTN